MKGPKFNSIVTDWLAPALVTKGIQTDGIMHKFFKIL